MTANALAHHVSAYAVRALARVSAGSLTLKVSLSSAAGVTRNTRVECTDAMIKITCPPYFLQVRIHCLHPGLTAARAPLFVCIRSHAPRRSWW